MAIFHNENAMQPESAAAAAAYTVDNSCRFDGTSAYLNRATTSTATTWTMAFWIKRAKLDTAQYMLTYSDLSTGSGLAINTSNQLYFYNNPTASFSTAVYRDTGAWMHVAIVCTSGSADFYINGTQVTDGGFSSSLSCEEVGTLNIGYWSFDSTHYYNGYMADIYFVDGAAKVPGDFAETDSNGQWVPKEYADSYGTNGFRIDFSDSADLGADAAGSNDFTTVNLVASDQMIDTPSAGKNYCTLNPLSSTVNTGYRTFTEGNLSYNTSSTGQWTDATGTIGLPDSGKWYFEVDIVTRPTVTTQNYFIGLVKNTAVDIPAAGPSRTGTMGFYCISNTAKKTKDGVDTTDGTLADADGEVYMVAVDMDLSKIWIGLEGTWFNSADPADADDTNYAYNSFGTDWNIMLSLYAYSGATGVLRLNTGADPTFAGNDPVATPATSEFAYTPPTGYSALATANLPDPTIADGTEHFDTLLYTGDGNQTGLDFTPDLTWIKNRDSSYSHVVGDVVRGDNNFLATNGSGEEGTDSTKFKSFVTGGIDVGDHDGTGNSSDDYVAWNWLAGTGFDPAGGSATTDGSKNATAGFSIAKWTGNSSATQAISHGLEAAPDFIVAKARTNNGYYFYGYEPHWCVYHKDLTSNNILYLDTSAAETSASGVFGSIGASTVTMGYSSSTGQDLNFGESGYTADDFIGYFFSEVAGYSKFGSYEGNGVADGPFVWCGFRPAWLLIKRFDATENWWVLDVKRDTYNVVNHLLYADQANTEIVGTGDDIPCDIVSNGFKLRTANVNWNSGATGNGYIFAAFAEKPFKYAAAR